VDLKIAKRKYDIQKNTAKGRNVPFLITFEEWCYVWEQSCNWDQRGRGKGRYGMSRKGDIGPYSVDNVFIQLHTDNVSDAQTGIAKVFSKEHKANLRKAMLGNKNKLGHIVTGVTKTKISQALVNLPTVTCPHCDKTGGNAAMKRWHFNNCKRKAA
jgi:hypothetical protein